MKYAYARADTFEIFIALFGGICGAYISMTNLIFIHWLLFGILLILSILFLMLWINYYRKSKVHQLSSDTELDKFPFRVVGFLSNINLNDITRAKKILEELNIKDESIYWHSNRIKTQFKTLKISQLSNKKMTIFVIPKNQLYNLSTL